MIIFISCVIAAHLSLTRFIHRIDLDVFDKKIVFYKYLSDKRIEVSFSNVQYISVGFYIKFTYSEGTVKFNEARNKSLAKVLKEHFIIHQRPAASIMKFFDK